MANKARDSFFSADKIAEALYSPTIMVAGLTAFGYLNALMFEIGYLNFYGINFVFARVTTETFILFGATVLVLAFLFVSNRGIFMMIVKPKVRPQNPVWRLIVWRLRTYLLLVLFMSPVLLYYHFWLKGIIATGLLILFITISDVFIDGWGEKGIIAKVNKAVNNPVVPANFIEKDAPIIMSIMLALFVLTLSAFVGNEFARQRTTYEVVEGKYLVIANYGGQYLFAGVDSNHQKLNGNYKLIENPNTFYFRTMGFDKLHK